MTALLALIPLARLASDYLAVAPVVRGTDQPGRGYDWVTWRVADGLITAAYVFSRDQDADAGLQEGDLFYRLDYRQYFTLEDLQRAIDGVSPGSIRTYSVLRGPQMEEIQVDVLFTRYPTFLYPLTPAMWQFSVWGCIHGGSGAGTSSSTE